MLPIGQKTSQDFPSMLLFGTKALFVLSLHPPSNGLWKQLLESVLALRLSPSMKYSPSGTLNTEGLFVKLRVWPLFASLR